MLVIRIFQSRRAGALHDRDPAFIPDDEGACSRCRIRGDQNQPTREYERKAAENGPLLSAKMGDIKMNDAKKIMKKKAVIKAEMDKALPKAQSDALWREATETLDGFLARYSALPRGVHMHTDSRILPSAAIYLTVKNAVGPERAYRIIEDAAVRSCAEIERKLRKLMKLPGMRGLFIRVWDPMTKKLFASGNGFQNVFYPKKKDEYRMDITACPYCRTFTELGCPELTKVFCENDERIYGRLPGLRFERTGTLGKGAERCDFRLKKG